MAIMEDKISLNWTKLYYLQWIIALLLWASNLEIKKEASRFRKEVLNSLNQWVMSRWSAILLFITQLASIFSHRYNNRHNKANNLKCNNPLLQLLEMNLQAAWHNCKQVDLIYRFQILRIMWRIPTSKRYHPWC